MTTTKWNEIRRGSKIHLSNPTIFETLGDPAKLLQPGYYYITGFWANACGLSTNQKDVDAVNNEVCIASAMLIKFDNITN